MAPAEDRETAKDELARRHAAERRQLAERHGAERDAAGLGQLPPGWPLRGTPEFAVWVAALDVATSPPLRHAETTSSAQVPWAEIDRLRAAIEAAGLDWRKIKAARHG